MKQSDKEFIIAKLRTALEAAESKKTSALKFTDSVLANDAFQYEKGKADGLMEAINLVRGS